jgi:hypothetical protein
MYEKHPLNADSFFLSQQIGSLPNNDECSGSLDECSASNDQLDIMDMQHTKNDERQKDSDQESESDFNLNNIGNSE